MVFLANSVRRQFMKGVALTILLLASSPLHAEPGPTVNWLMNEPVTLWDWGIKNLRSYTKEVTTSLRSLYSDQVVSNVQYSLEDNEITISLIILDNPELTESKCKEIRERFLAVVSIHELRFLDERAAAWLESAFSHEGFHKTSRPEDLGNRLIRITFVEASMHSNEQGLSCRGRIVERDPSFKRYEPDKE